MRSTASAVPEAVYTQPPDIVTINIQPNVKVVAFCLVIALIVGVVALIAHHIPK